MELVRYADRPDLREIRLDTSRTDVPGVHDTTTQSGSQYWGRLYDEFRDFQLALLDGGRLVAEVHALSVPGRTATTCRRAGTTRSSAGSRRAAADVLSLLAISVYPTRRGEGLAARMLIAAMRDARPLRQGSRP